MGPGTFLIAILGCGEADAPCEPVRTLDTPYQSEAACSEATDAALMRYGDADYPVVVARCVKAGVAPAKLRADEVRLPDPAKAPVRVAGGRRG